MNDKSTLLPVKVFGIENWWGCMWRRTAGAVATYGVSNNTSKQHEFRYKLTYGTIDGSDVIGYNINGDGYISKTDALPLNMSYIKSIYYSDAIYPILCGDTQLSEYYDDFFWKGKDGTNILNVGGSIDGWSDAGNWAWYFANSHSNMYLFSTNLSCKPNL